MALNLTSLYNYLGLSKLGGKWGLLAIIFTLLNLKSVPLGWHVRMPQFQFRYQTLTRAGSIIEGHLNPYLEFTKANSFKSGT